MDGDDHVKGLGKVLQNLQGFELLLRFFLSETHGEQLALPEAEANEVAETHFTNYDSLAPLIKKYNAALASNEARYAVDASVVDVRDALAHGRSLTAAPEFPLTLYKFGRPQYGRVPVELTVILSKEWFSEKVGLLHAQMKNVHECGQQRGYASFPKGE